MSWPEGWPIRYDIKSLIKEARDTLLTDEGRRLLGDMDEMDDEGDFDSTHRLEVRIARCVGQACGFESSHKIIEDAMLAAFKQKDDNVAMALRRLADTLKERGEEARRDQHRAETELVGKRNANRR